jgi:hypothetical protein
MAEVTNRIPFDEARDLLERPGRACVGFVVDGRPHIEAVDLRYQDGRFLVGIGDDTPQPDGDAEVVLVVDEGVLFFDLRAVYVRGGPRPIPPAGGGGRTWYDVDPVIVTCWDYGRLRSIDDGA